MPGSETALVSEVTEQLRRFKATINDPYTEPVPVQQFARVSLLVIGGERAQRKRFEKQIKERSKVIAAMREWETQNPLPAQHWDLGKTDTRDPYGQLTHVSAAVATFLRRVAWSREQRALMPPLRREELDFTFGNPGDGLDVEINDKRRVLCPLGYDDSHHYFLDALDASPDPMVYMTDEDGLDESAMCSLSRFLTQMSAKPK
jgi:hypothetical protein